VLLNIAGHTNRAARFWVDLADFSTLQTNDDALRNQALRLLDLLLVHDNGVCTGAAAEYTSTLCFGANVEHLRAERYHVDGQAVSSRCCLGGKHTGINLSTHAGNQILGNAGPVALHLVSRAQAVGGNNVRLLSCAHPCEEGQMCSSVGVVLDPFDNVLAGQVALVVDNAYAPLVSSTPVSHCDASGVVSPSQVLSLALNGELEERPPLPQMVVYGSLEMTQTGRAGLVCAQRDELLLPRALGREHTAVGRCSRRIDGRLDKLLEALRVVAGARAQQRPPEARGLEAAYPGLQHGVEECPGA
jgi:hypothetical protein